MFDEHAFDEIEAKFKATLDNMKKKLKDASGRYDAASSHEMEKKIKDTAEKMADKIKEAALKLERKLEKAGMKPDAPELDEIEEDLNMAAEEMDHAFESASHAMDQAAEAAAQSVDEAAERHASTFEVKFEAAGKKLEDIKMDDVEDKLKSAAKAVEDKLNEAGKKLDELLNDPKTKEKAEEAGRQINSFFNKAGDSIASGIDSFMKSVTHAAETFKKDWDETRKKADDHQDEGDE